jgi:hypothetical protein
MELLDPAIDYILSKHYFAEIHVYMLRQILISCRKFWSNLPARINSWRDSLGLFLHSICLFIYLQSVQSLVFISRLFPVCPWRSLLYEGLKINIIPCIGYIKNNSYTRTTNKPRPHSATSPVPSTLHYLTTTLHILHQWTKPHYSYFFRFGHQKAVLTNVLLKMGIIMLETCWVNKPEFCRI